MKNFIGRLVTIILIAWLFLVLFPSICFADIGVPMLALEMPFMLPALIPIILIEVAIFKRGLKNSYKEVILPVASANLVSTLLGFPLVWALVLGIELLSTGGYALGLLTMWEKIASVTLQAAWLIPYGSDLYWMEPIALMVGLIPAFFASVYIEYFVIRRFFDEDRRIIKRLSWKANAVTYTILLGFSAIYLVYNIVSGP